MNILASWLGLGLLFGLVLVIKGWSIYAGYRRMRRRRRDQKPPPDS